MTWVLDSTRIKQTFLRPTSDKGTSVPFWTTGFRRFCVTAVWGFFLFLPALGAFTPAPSEAVKALKITKGKPFSKGAVFVDGRFIEPPYVVERYGNVIRINKIQVTNPIYDWSEFLRTQSDVKVTRTESAPVADPKPAPPPPPPPPVVENDEEVDLLDELFGDAPAKPKKPVRKPTPVRAAAPRPAAPKVTTTLSLSGAFEMNAKSTMMVNKINAQRTEIDASLRRGCFICFGSTYSRVLGDKGAMQKVLQKLPEIMKQHSDFAPFAAAVRKEGFVYFPSNLVRQLFDHRVDYLKLQKRWKQVFEEQELNFMLEKAGVSNY